MSNGSLLQAEIHDLVDAVCECNPPPEALERLEALLLTDDEACRYCLEYLSLHGALMLADGSEACQMTSISEQAAIRGTEGDTPFSPIVLDVSGGGCYPSSESFIGGPVFSYLVATVVLCAMLISAWAYRFSISDSQFVDSPMPSSGLDDSVPEYVGVITGAKDCRWAKDSMGTMVGASAPMGRKYALDAGLLEITYSSGAKVILEGPCVYTVDSDAGGYLAVGKLTAQVKSGGLAALAASAKPQVANPQPPTSPLFTISTPTAIVTDLGTEFGVEVDKAGNTVSHVFQGLVRVETLLSSSTRTRGQLVQLGAGESARVEHNSVGSLLISRNKVDVAQAFTRLLPVAKECESIVDGSIFQDEFNGNALAPGKWSVISKRGGSVSVADGSATIRSAADQADGVLCVTTANPVNYGDTPDDWWVEFKFKMEDELLSAYPLVRDWVIFSGISFPWGKCEMEGFDLRAMQRGNIDSETFDLGWWGFDNMNENRIPQALARGLKKGQYYVIRIHRKPDGKMDVFLDGQLIAEKPLVASRNPRLLSFGDRSILGGGIQVFDYIKVGKLANEQPVSKEKTEKEAPME